jgi:hypothetical protein
MKVSTLPFQHRYNFAKPGTEHTDFESEPWRCKSVFTKLHRVFFLSLKFLPVHIFPRTTSDFCHTASLCTRCSDLFLVASTLMNPAFSFTGETFPTHFCFIPIPLREVHLKTASKWFHSFSCNRYFRSSSSLLSSTACRRPFAISTQRQWAVALASQWCPSRGT